MNTNDIRNKIEKLKTIDGKVLKRREKLGLSTPMSRMGRVTAFADALALIPKDHILVPKKDLLTKDEWNRLTSELLIARDAYCEDDVYDKLLKKLKTFRQRMGVEL